MPGRELRILRIEKPYLKGIEVDLGLALELKGEKYDSDREHDLQYASD